MEGFMFSFLISFALSCGDNGTETQETNATPEDAIQKRIEAGGPIFTLDLTQAERLLDIFKPEEEKMTSHSPPGLSHRLGQW